jgi:hypothetical protein
MSARGLFVKRNGTWQAVTNPTVKQGGTWTSFQAGYVKKNGVWQQFFPGNLVAKVLIVAGGGGGGVGYGYEGGGGGGAGGVIYRENIVLQTSAGASYSFIVGAGGTSAGVGANQQTSLGTRPYTYNDFASEYGFNVSDVQAMGGVYTAAGPFGLNRKPESGGLAFWVNGYVASGRNFSALANSIHNSAIQQGSGNDYLNASLGPAAGIPFGAGSYSGQLLDKPDIDLGSYTSTGGSGSGNDSSAFGLVAKGGGGGGWGVPEQTAAPGGSGGGGCGYSTTHPGGAGTPGQGFPGGTGVWQGYGAAGGGGGGGFAGAGNSSNGNGGGDGGSGTRLLGFAVAGGGGGGYGNQGTSGTGPGGAGGGAGAGVGNGGNANASTGSGGGGGLHGGQTTGGSGGSGMVVVQYPAGRAFFTGGTITVDNGVVTHVFTTTGVLAAITTLNTSLA